MLFAKNSQLQTIFQIVKSTNARYEFKNGYGINNGITDLVGRFQVAQYIGEMCRYILATPDNAADTKHDVRTIFGNGLRPQIWPQFVKRFGIPNVAEFYGATEGNANIGRSNRLLKIARTFILLLSLFQLILTV